MANNTMLRRDFLAVLPAAAVLPGAVVSPPAPGRLARRDSFLGMHFDLHPGPDDMTLGRDLTDDMVERFLARVKPDYVQYDCKGHPGYLGYQSKVSRAAGHIVNDSLEIWRRVTEKHGVSLFIHFSGVWDGLAVVEHPEWARLDPDGKADAKVTSTFGPYVDERMIPQLKEAAARYRLDGAWVDGECWAVKPDYSPAAAKAFQEKTGITTLPKAPGERGWQEFLEFNREQFRSYVRHYVEALHAAQPGFQIASNWLYSSFVPERPTLAVDYISGDFLGNASISTARLDARYMGQTGKPWDLMAWGFQNSSEPGAVTPINKPAVMLQQEASVVLAQGGGFQAYFVPTRSGWIDELRIETMGKVADFCRARQSFSHKSEPVPQVGVIFSGRTLYRTSKRMFGGWGSQVNAARGMVDALVECGYSVDVIPDWKLEEVMARYPLLVLPEWTEVGPEVKASLAAYVTGGGRLLLAGAANVTLWAAELGLALRGEAHEQMAHLTGVETMGTANGVWQDVEAKGATVLEWRYPAMDTRRDGLAAATLSVLGKGEVVAVAGPLGSVFAVTHAPAIRQFVGRLAGRVFRPAFRLEAPPVLEAALRRKDGKTYLHLCNAQAMQVASEYAATDYIPAAGPVRVLFRERPRRAVLLPQGQALKVERRGEEWVVTVASIAIHSAIAVDL